MKAVIECNNVSMLFNMGINRVGSIKESIIRLICLKNNLVDWFTALDDISFVVEPGGALGIIGKNGSGKSTLLKVLCRVLTPTTGSVKTYGHIAPLIELGAGFDPNLTARENIWLNGILLGYSRKWLRTCFDDIVAFSGLEQFLDVPVKNFSSGMFARLGFSIATAVKPDILIVDEVLSVGDAEFTQKCECRISELLKGGTTLLLVSHNQQAIRTLCSSVIWLDSGKIREQGAPDEVLQKYLCPAPEMPASQEVCS
ncbi:ABC transporter ATP-binding protein [Desulfovibrio falkowii]|uniref:ABC transporter domain-containing protein n=1 Tax=Desulfovibrio falkowii TaxID=3136602 RepID=A0ABQ0E766_9BACT